MNKYHRRPVTRQENIETNPMARGIEYAKAKRATADKGYGDLSLGGTAGRVPSSMPKMKKTDTAKMADGFNLVRPKRTPAKKMTDEIAKRVNRLK